MIFHIEYPFVLKIVVICDQLTSLKIFFYKFNYFKPNRSVSSFGIAQLDNTKSHSAVIVISSYKNTPLCPKGHNNQDELKDPKNVTLTSVKYTKENIFLIIIKFYKDLFF